MLTRVLRLQRLLLALPERRLPYLSLCLRGLVRRLNRLERARHKST